jgi:hypothetical protein
MSVGGSTTNSPAFTLFPIVSGTVPATKVDKPRRNIRTLEMTMLFLFFMPDLLSLPILVLIWGDVSPCKPTLRVRFYLSKSPVLK